jgi:hypothetical protein
MEPLPFALRVPGKDTFTFTLIGSTRFRFRGLLRLVADALELEWTGTARVDEVGFTGIRAERLALPLESLTLPIDELRTIALRGGWLRPHLEIAATRLGALRIVPGEEAGTIRLWIARLDRRLASQLVAALNQQSALAPVEGDTPQAGALPVATPP